MFRIKRVLAQAQSHGELPNQIEFMANERLQLGSDAAGTHQTPAANRFKKGEQTGGDKDDSQPENVIHHDDARDEHERSHHTTRHAPAMIQIAFQETIHADNIAHRVPVIKMLNG